MAKGWLSSCSKVILLTSTTKQSIASVYTKIIFYVATNIKTYLDIKETNIKIYMAVGQQQLHKMYKKFLSQLTEYWFTGLPPHKSQ